MTGTVSIFRNLRCGIFYCRPKIQCRNYACEMTSWGEFSVFDAGHSAFFLSGGKILSASVAQTCSLHFSVSEVGGTLLGALFSNYVIPFNVCHLQLALCGGIVLTLAFLYLRERLRAYFYVILFVVGSGHHFSSRPTMYSIRYLNLTRRFELKCYWE